MKKTLKLILTFACIAALVLSLGVGAFAYTDEEIDAMFEELDRANDAQEIQNLMSWHVMYHCYGEHRAEMLNIWVEEPENQATASFGQNQGFMAGYGTIWEGYVEGHDQSWLSSAKSYCSKNGIDVSGMTDEEILDMYGGVGQLLLHVTTTGIIEVAKDGKTAKAFWYSPGMIAESGQNANTIWEAYGADFIKEGDTWKLWHLHMFTDFMGSFYISIGGNGGGSGEAKSSEQQSYEGEGGNVLYHAGLVETSNYAPETTHDYLSSVQYSQFSSSRLRADMEIFLPVAYDTWSFDDANYGPTAEEWESLGVDLDAWYAANGGEAAPAEAAGSVEDAYVEYIHEWLLSELEVNSSMTIDQIEDEFMPLIEAGDYVSFPAEMLYGGMLESGVAMTFEEFAAQY